MTYFDPRRASSAFSAACVSGSAVSAISRNRVSERWEYRAASESRSALDRGTWKNCVASIASKKAANAPHAIAARVMKSRFISTPLDQIVKHALAAFARLPAPHPREPASGEYSDNRQRDQATDSEKKRALHGANPTAYPPISATGAEL